MALGVRLLVPSRLSKIELASLCVIATVTVFTVRQARDYRHTKYFYNRFSWHFNPQILGDAAGHHLGYPGIIHMNDIHTGVVLLLFGCSKFWHFVSLAT